MTSLQEAISTLPWFVLWLGACVGHTFFMVTGLNVLYAWPLPHFVLRFTRKIDLLSILAGPVVFLLALDLFGNRSLAWEPGSVSFYLTPYTLFCAALGFIAFPIAQTLYMVRKRAERVAATETATVDVAAKLGRKPVGRGKYRPLALLPGNEVFTVDFVTHTLALPQLPPEWDGLSILHLTDLHLSGTPDRAFHRFVIDRCMADGVPDIVAITGDVVDSKTHHRWIVPVLGRLRWNVAGFAILGNHDSWRDTHRIRGRLRKLRLQVLGNTWVKIEVRGVPMVVVGHEAPWFKPEPDLYTCPRDVFRFLLSHTPDNIPWARRHGIDLMLAGHVHGGQIRFPFLGSVFCPSRYSRRYDCGTFYEEPTLMHVGRGLAGQHPLRYNCKPEVTRIILRKNA